MDSSGAKIFAFGTPDPDEFTERIQPVSPLMKIHHQGREDFSGKVTASRLARTSVFSVDVQAFRVLGPVTRPYLSLTIPLGGDMEIHRGRFKEVFTRGNAHVQDADEWFDLAVPRMMQGLVVNIDRQFLLEQSANLQDGTAPPPFDNERLSLLSGRGASLWWQIALLRSEINRQAPWLESEPVVGEAEAHFVALLLFALAEKTDDTDAPDVGAFVVRQTVEYIHNHFAAPVTLADLAVMARTSVRSLLRAFRRETGTTPMQYLKARRLEAAHRDLLVADPAITTVTEVALRCGLLHLGRFASIYQATFGERPSQTLRRA